MVGNRLLLPSAQIENLYLSAGRARIIVGVSVNDEDVKHLAAFVAPDRHWHWKAPFHKLEPIRMSQEEEGVNGPRVRNA